MHHTARLDYRVPLWRRENKRNKQRTREVYLGVRGSRKEVSSINRQDHLDKNCSFTPRHPFLQNTGSVHETVVGVCNGEKREVCLGRGEALARKTNSDVHSARRYAGLRKVWGHAREVCLVDERPFHVDEEPTLRKTDLKRTRGKSRSSFCFISLAHCHQWYREG